MKNLNLLNLQFNKFNVLNILTFNLNLLFEYQATNYLEFIASGSCYYIILVKSVWKIVIPSKFL